MLTLLFSAGAFAQKPDPVTDSVIKHIRYYQIQKSSVSMFAHLDKTVYVNNEMLWFTAYLLNCPPADIPRHEVLAALLVNDNTQVIAAQAKFVMGNGLSYGNLAIPDSIPPGNYSFIAYTNCIQNKRPASYFIQHITLKSTAQSTFNAAITLDTLYKNPLTVRAILQVDNSSAPVANAKIAYYLGKGLHTGFSGNGETNLMGSYVLMIPKKYITPAQHTLEVSIKHQTYTKVLHLAIPVKKDHQLIDVKFYPEGGSLISGMLNQVGWEVKTATGDAVKTAAILYAGNKATDTIETDSFGMGRFKLAPIGNVAYTVKLIDQVTNVPYSLPAALTDGVVLQVNDALANDTLHMVLKSNYAGRFYLLVHNYNQLFSAERILTYPQGRIVKVNLSAIPRGLNTITILDSLQRPLAERLFFAHYNQQQRMAITNGNGDIGTRQKITLKLKLNGVGGKPVRGMVSVACVQDNRFTVKNNNNIENYAYLQNEIEDLPLKDNLMGNTRLDRNYLNELMLVRGWRKYKWVEMQRSSPADTVLKQDSMVYKGVVKQFAEPIKKPVQMAILRNGMSTELMATNNKGEFTMSNGNALTNQGKRLNLVVNGHSDEYTIKIADPYPGFAKMLAGNVAAVRYEAPIAQNTSEYVLKGFEHATNLREVVINGSGDKTVYGANECGDYICRFKVLNCGNHRYERDNRPPVIGQKVYVQNQGVSTYTGCDNETERPGVFSFVGIYNAKEFYGADYSQINPTEPDYLSTIFWKYNIIITPDKEAEISFYTSDVTGKFRIVVQGITDEDVIYGEDTFTVNKKVAGK